MPKWTIFREPVPQKCSHMDCRQYIPFGDLCIRHGSGGFGCKTCGYKWWSAASLIPSDLAEQDLTFEDFLTAYTGPTYSTQWKLTAKPKKCNVDTRSASNPAYPKVYCGHSEIPAGVAAAKYAPAYDVWWCADCSQALGAFYNPTAAGVPPELTLVAEGLQRAVLKQSGPPLKDKPSMITLTSFSYKKTAPPSIVGKAGWRVFDLRRSVRNPWQTASLRKLNGKDQRVKDFILRCPKSAKVIEGISNYGACGYQNIWVGCQGGKHRSVAAVEIAAARLRELGHQVEVVHKDLVIK